MSATVIPKIGRRIMSWATRNAQRTIKCLARQIDPNSTGLTGFQPAMAGPAINGASIPTVRVPDRTIPDVRVIQNANNGSDSVAGGSGSQQVSRPAKKEVDADLITYAKKYRTGKIKSGIGYAFSMIGGALMGSTVGLFLLTGIGFGAYFVLAIGLLLLTSGQNIRKEGSKQMRPSKELVKKYRERNLPDVFKTIQPGATRKLQRTIYRI